MDASRREPARFFIPFQFMRPTSFLPQSKAGQAVKSISLQKDATDELRNDFHNFVFIYTTQDRIRSIVDSSWNREARLHLYHYRDTNGKVVTIPELELQQLKETFQNRQLKYFFGQPIGEMSVGDTVVLQFEPWIGKTAKIEKMAYKKGRLNMTVSVNILNRTKSIKFSDLHNGDVRFQDEDCDKLISGDLISNFEEEVVIILGHRFRQKATADTARKDKTRLNRLLGYSNIKIDDADDSARFKALMLICAYLLSEKNICEPLQAQLLELLNGATDANTSTEAYLMTALFISTRNPRLRDAVKAYRKTHTDCPDIIRRFMTKVSDIKTRLPQ